MTTIDTSIDNYSVDDILRIFNLTDPTPFNVQDVANSLIAKMTTEGKPDLVVFFTLARDKVLADIQQKVTDNLALDNEATESLNKIWTDGSIQDNSENPVRYFTEGSHVAAEKIIFPLNTGISSQPIIATHIINVDSQYRSNILPYSNSPLSNSFNTNFTFNITSPITRAISLRLYSYQLPTSWYAFNATSGNTFFMYNGVIITIPDGNYSPTTLVAAINAEAALNTATIGLTVTYNSTTNKISFTNNDALSGLITVTFFIQANIINYNNCSSLTLGAFQTLGVNTTLGWLLGFRTTPDPITGDVYISIGPNATITADVSPQTSGPSYFVLSLEDFSNQRLSSGLYSVTSIKNYATVSIPDYYSTRFAECKLREGILTAAQLYAINAVIASSPNKPDIKNATTGFNNKLSGPNSGAAFAMIPLSDVASIRPNPYVKFGADLNIYVRNYSGPTNLQRFSVSLTDDKGILVNLNDNDWSFSLIVEEQLN